MKVLYASDGRPPAVAAGELLRKLVDPERVTVTILHASEFGNELVADSYAANVLDQAENAFRDAGIRTERLYVDGEPVFSVAKELAQDEYGFTVLGAGNHGRLGRLVFGSVSTHVLHEAPIPVLVVHRAPDPSHERLHVLVGADGSPSAAHAIDTLASITEPDRVDIHVRTVIRTPELAFSAHPGAYVPTSYIEELLAEEKVIAGRHLNDALDRLRVSGFSPRHHRHRMAGERSPRPRREEGGGSDRRRRQGHRSDRTDDDGVGERPRRGACASDARRARPGPSDGRVSHRRARRRRESEPIHRAVGWNDAAWMDRTARGPWGSSILRMVVVSPVLVRPPRIRTPGQARP